MIGEYCEPPEPFQLEIEEVKGLSREAQEFLSLSAGKQERIYNYFNPPKQYICTDASPHDSGIQSLADLSPRYSSFVQIHFLRI